MGNATPCETSSIGGDLASHTENWREPDLDRKLLAVQHIDHVRDSPRSVIELPIQFWIDRPNASFTRFGETSNLSVGGAFVRTDFPPAADTRLKLEVTLPTLWEPLRTTGRVCWARAPEGSPDQPGFGVEFQIERGEQAAALCMLLEQAAF